MIDLSNGATGIIARNVFVQGEDKENYSVFIAIAPEGAEHSSAGLTVTATRPASSPACAAGPPSSPAGAARPRLSPTIASIPRSPASSGAYSRPAVALSGRHAIAPP